MKKERKDNSFIKKPVYLGGLKAMKKFIADNKKYPKAALENNIEGTVSLRYTINHVGKVIATDIISGLGYGCDEEAVRVVKLLKYHVDKVRGLRVTFKKEVHIHFKKPKKVIQKIPQLNIRYETKKKGVLKEQSTKKGYSYTIQIGQNE